MKVRTIRRGYDNLCLREVGDVFEWPDGVKLPTWVKPAASPGRARSRPTPAAQRVPVETPKA